MTYMYRHTQNSKTREPWEGGLDSHAIDTHTHVRDIALTQTRGWGWGRERERERGGSGSPHWEPINQTDRQAISSETDRQTDRHARTSNQASRSVLESDKEIRDKRRRETRGEERWGRAEGKKTSAAPNAPPSHATYAHRTEQNRTAILRASHPCVPARQTVSPSSPLLSSQTFASCPFSLLGAVSLFSTPRFLGLQVSMTSPGSASMW